jgi:diacylglycerol kinase
MKGRLSSFKNAGIGIITAYKTQPNLWIQSLMAMAVCMAGFMLTISVPEWLILILCIFFVLVSEIFNTAVETLTDLVQPEFHPLAGKVKDIAAGAVLFASAGTIICGCIIFLPKIV